MSADESEEDTLSSLEQLRVERAVQRRFARFLESSPSTTAALLREPHAAFLWNAIDGGISYGFASLDAAQPWLCYWTVHALDLLGALDNDADRAHLGTRLAAHLRARAFRDGQGFCGFPCDALPHLASTYAAVSALVACGSDAALGAIDRRGMQRFLHARKCALSGGFSMHDDGEVDVRGLYCALSIAALLNVATEPLLHNAGAFLVACQSYEGGISGTPGGEAHGGYSFCGLAAALLVERLRAQLGLPPDALSLDYRRLLDWVVRRQLPVEGGFQGRTNKLVDSCYSWWQGAVVALLHQRLAIGTASLLCSQFALQTYVLVCCQDEQGGLCDKPGKHRDFYHSCYALSGLAAMQWGAAAAGAPAVWGDASVNALPRIDLLHCLRVERVARAKQFFQ
jgi:protein farnesyltransferase subunit beta